MPSYSVQENMTLKAAGTKRRSQVTENAIKKLETLLGLSCLFICFISGYARHMFGIDHASRCCKSKRTKYRKLHIVLEHSFSRSDSWRPRNEALSSLHAKELGLRFWEENALLTFDCTAMPVADVGLLVHTLLGFNCKILVVYWNPSNYENNRRSVTSFITTTRTIS